MMNGIVVMGAVVLVILIYIILAASHDRVWTCEDYKHLSDQLACHQLTATALAGH
jgi:hypothetical protein